MHIEAFRKATVADCEAIARLVNKAYRPEPGAAGWTHESELVSGERISVTQVREAIASPESAVLLGLVAGEIGACVHVENEGAGCCRIGMLAVDPALQGAGAGKDMLALAECYARDSFGADRLTMFVLSARSELVSFYQRRGYRRTGRVKGYPTAAGVGTPRCQDLVVEQLEKSGVCGASGHRSLCTHGSSD